MRGRQHTMPGWARVALALAVTVLGAGCATLDSDGAQEPSSVEPELEDAPAAMAPATESAFLTQFDLEAANDPEPLRFRVDDSLRFTVWNHADLTHVAQVQPNGAVTLPLVGEILADGRTPMEIREEAEDRIESLMDRDSVTFRAQDVVKMVVWEHPELTHVAEVQPDGYVVFPLANEVLARGRTVGDVREDVRARLAKYLDAPQISILPERLPVNTVVNPRVSILPEELIERRVAVLGEVIIPGVQTLRGPMRVLEALANAGPKETAKLNDIIVIRDADGQSPTYQYLQLKDYMNGKEAVGNIYLQDGDIIIVPMTIIAKTDKFINQFFAQTKPVFDWWISLWYARFAEDIFESTARVNELVFDAIP